MNRTEINELGEFGIIDKIKSNFKKKKSSTVLATHENQIVQFLLEHTNSFQSWPELRTKTNNTLISNGNSLKIGCADWLDPTATNSRQQ